jgi:hypothetical protein
MPDADRHRCHQAVVADERAEHRLAGLQIPDRTVWSWLPETATGRPCRTPTATAVTQASRKATSCHPDLPRPGPGPGELTGQTQTVLQARRGLDEQARAVMAFT